MGEGARIRWTIASHVAPQAFAPRARQALCGLGYRFVSEHPQGHSGDASRKPDLLIVDEHRLEALPAEQRPPHTPIILLTGRGPRKHRPPNVVGALPRPAQFERLYPLLQQALETTPRRAARVTTRLPARCTRGEWRWMGAVLDLSEDGCLIRAGDAMEPDLEFDLLFPLPSARLVSTGARIVRRDGDLAGTIFRETAPHWRDAIRNYVTERLASG